MEPLNEAVIAGSLTTAWLGRPCRYLPTTGSTNDLLRQSLNLGNEQEPPAGTMILTDFQTRGKGRLDRRWEAPAGSSLLFSLLFRPHWPAEQASWLTMMGCLATAVAIEAETGLSIQFKWPNDLVIKREQKWYKLGGLLLEGAFGDNGRLEAAILGIGINVNIPAEQLPEAATPATSLFVEYGRPVSRLALLNRLLSHLETVYQDTAVHSPQPRWQERLITLGQPVQVTASTSAATQPPLRGIAEGTDEWGRLLVRDEAGLLHKVAAGDVSLRQS